jgi:hypothetical protein
MVSTSTIMRILVKRATAAAVSTMGRETESSHASDSGVGTKNSSRRRRLRRSRSTTRMLRISLVDPPSNAARRAAAPPRRSADRSIAVAAGESRSRNGPRCVSMSGLNNLSVFGEIGLTVKKNRPRPM